MSAMQELVGRALLLLTQSWQHCRPWEDWQSKKMRLQRVDGPDVFWLILRVVSMVASLRYSLFLVVSEMDNSAMLLRSIVTVSVETQTNFYYDSLRVSTSSSTSHTQSSIIIHLNIINPTSQPKDHDPNATYIIWLLFLFDSTMPAQDEFTSNQLGQALEEISQNFAYKMLHLEISLSVGNASERNRSVQIADLTALYMKAVESLQGRYEQGFAFFHEKIQNLMKRRSVVEELFKSVNSSLSTSEKTMKVISKAEVDQRKEEYQLRMTLQNQKFDHKRVKEMIKTAEMKINMIQSQIKTGIFSQEESLAARIKIRKMKSESSLNGDEAEGVKERTFKKRVQTENSQDDFDHAQTAKKPRKRSTGKDPNRKLQHLFGSFSGGIKI